MKTAATLLAGLALLASPLAARAQDELRVALPASHDLIELQPGLQVIPGFELEVFYAGGTYWMRADGGWYSARRTGSPTVFRPVEARALPAALAKLPAGSYLDYRAGPGQQRSTKVLTTMDPAEPEAEAAPVKAEPAVKPAPARVEPAAKPAPAKAAPAPAKKPPAAKPLPRKK